MTFDREPEVLWVEEGMPEVRCSYCERLREVGQDVLDCDGDLYCSQRCINQHHEMMMDPFWNN